MFSIIVPTWQRAALLPRCLASVAVQPGAWECLVVDDGSTDATADVVGAWAARDPRFRLLPRDHQGVAAARNAGIAAARGTWLAFLDSDDEYLPGALDVLARATAAVPGTRVVCGGLTGNLRVDRSSSMDGSILVRDATLELLGFAIATPRVQLIAAAFHRDVVEACGGFDPELPSAEDRAWLVRVAERYPFTIVRTFVARYHEGHGEGKSDRSLVDGTKLPALRRILAAVREPARLRDAHLGMLDAVQAIRDGALDDARVHISTAAARCDDAELDALLLRFVYLLTYPVSDPAGASSRTAATLHAFARGADPRLAARLVDAGVAVRLWAARSLQRAGAYRAALSLAASTLRAPGLRRTITAFQRLWIAQRN